MKPKTTAVILAAWLALLSVLFVFFQFRGHQVESPAPEFLIALVKIVPVLLVAAGLGSAISRRSPASASDLVPFAAVGLAVFGIAALAMGGLGIIRPYTFWILVAGCAIATRKNLLASLRRIRDVGIPGDGKPVYVPFLVLAAIAAAMSLVATLAPLTANDALVYHLNIPRIYAAEGSVIRLPHNAYANMPHYGEMLYTMFFSIAGEAGAKLFYFFVLMGATGAVYVLAARFVDRGLALVAGTLFLVHPLLIDHRIVCNVDVMLAFFYLSAVTLLLERHGDKTRGWYVLPVAIVAGFMLGMKYTAVLPCASLLLVPALVGPRAWKRIGAAIVISLLIFAPWAVKNEAYVGNPVYPLLENTFDGQNWDPAQSEQLISWQRSMGMGRTAADYLMLPVNVSTRGKPGLNYTRFDGILSPVLLILLPFALFRRKRRTTMLWLMAAAGFVFWALTSQQLRFLIPALALGAVLAGVGLGNLRAWLGRKGFAAALVLLLIIQVSSLLVPDQYGRPFVSGIVGDRLPVAVGLETGRNFLARNVQSYSLFEQMNENLPPGEPVFLIWENRGYYLDRPYFADSFYEASTLMRILESSGSPDDLKRKIRGMGYRYVVVNEMLGEFFSKAYPPGNAALLEAFIAGHLTPVHSVNRLTLYTIDD